MPRRRLWLTLAAGALLSVALLVSGLRIDAGRDELRDEAALVAAASALRAQIDALDGQVRDVAGLFAASEAVEPDEFEAFARPMLNRSDASLLVFLRDVAAAERERVEREEGYPIRELGRDGELHPAGARARYLVITRSVYVPGGRNVRGLDVLPLPHRASTLARVEQTGDVAANASAELVYDGQRSLFLFAPVARGARLAGVIAGAYEHRVFAENIQRALNPGVALRVTADDLTLGGVGEPREDARRSEIRYGGVVFGVAVTAAREGSLRFGGVAFGLGCLLTALAVILQQAAYTRQRLAIGEARFADAFEASPVGQALASPGGRFQRVNPALCALTGESAEALCGGTAVDLVHPSDRERVRLLVGRAFAEQGVAVGAEVRLLTADGGSRWAQIHFTRLREVKSGSPLLAQVIDVSERRGLEVELRHQAEHDALTELLNRRGFQRRLQALLERAPGGGAGAVMLIDLDHFKAVNDTLGHHVGDQVIHAAGSALRHSLRADDIVARIGGDEFAVLLPGASRERAEATAERLVQAVAREARVEDMGGGHGVSASVGVAMLDGSFATADDALMAADLAMYDAKHAGRRRTAFYEDGSASATQTRLQWVDRIRTALAEERLALVAQPIVDLTTGRVHHEILLRMLDADGAHLTPGSFLPIAEQFGLMGDIDRWVVARAIGAIAANPDRELVFEINLSGSSLGSREVLDAIRDALIAGDVGPGCVIFEITETAAVTNLDEAYRFASELAALGCRFALDDFGVGFGSFAYVKHLPFDFLKIDGEFVRNSATSAADRVILESLIHAARGLEKRTIAEYVEDAETVALLRELGVDMVQGFHIGVPRDLADVIADAALKPPRPRSPVPPAR